METKQNVLIVDDDRAACDTLADILKEKGYNTSFVTDGKSTLKILSEKKDFFNIILLDIKLPDVDGITLLKKIKAAHPKCSCIVITGYATLENVIDALDDGADGYFIKPLNIAEVLYKIKEVLEKQRLYQELQNSEKKYKNAYRRLKLYEDLFLHDVNNILQIIQTSNDIIQMVYESSNDKQLLEKIMVVIRDQVNRGKNLVSNIMKLSNLEEERYLFKDIDPLPILNEIINKITSENKHRTLTIKVKTNLMDVKLKANELIRDIFENIIINAIKFNKNDEIEISINISKIKINQREYIKFEFKDNGIGVPDHLKPIIFNRFDLADENIKYFGLGLTLVKRILDLYSGNIWVEDRIPGSPEKGSNFIFIIPGVNEN
ncbi:MAG: response regulator [Promethearchaeota archaeon]